MALTDDGTVHCGASVACPFRDGPTLKCSYENAANALQSEPLIVGPCLECIASHIPTVDCCCAFGLCVAASKRASLYSTLMFPVISAFLFLHNEVQTCPKMTN